MAIQVGITIDRSSPVPLYHQLAEQLRAAIRSGQLQPGDPFENEMALAERLNLSRPTVRRAIQELVSQGLLLRRRGLGTTVANRKVHRRAELTSLYDDLKRDSARPTTAVLQHELVRDERVAASLDLPVDAELLSIVRLRFSDNRPLAILHNWLPPSYADITREQLEAQGLYALLRDRGVRPVVAHQTIGARTPTAAQRRHLRLKPSEPVLTMTRSAFDSAGNPVEYGDHCYRAQDYSIEVMIDER
ncbi:GntR family transcriptional regulator [Micromonospora globispora]|uniref:GntR family transcriptional regulator n=1 Tax=Micromonospora globispora TaxID=1450148 RepID=UPI000D702F89|nr:GntR family transcriptional regulator [Micromonospora globispora]PWU59207.1 GntR family transcriptional regulator [Micromonospora globispora]RQX05972.1 GntR family transcriptional regulator [Micromonospora globispora]